MARIAGLEGYAGGQRWTFAPMVDHPVDPRWGRVVETYGEAPLLASDMGVATIAGFHGSLADQPGIPAPRDFGVATCLKHLIGYGAVQGGKDYAWVDLSERTMRELHLPPFAAGIAAGAPAIMPAFTTGPGGVPMTANRRVLQDIVRRELGFDGIFISDYAAVTEMRLHGTAADDLEAAVAALRDGTMTMDMEDGVYYAQLPRAVESGAVDEAQIDREVLRVLAFKRRLGLWRHPYVPEDLERRVRLTPAHRAAALEVARRGVVLMKNDAALLPLEGRRRILVVGPLADSADDMLGSWQAQGRAADAITVLQGIRERAGTGGRHAIEVSHSEGCKLDEDGNGDPGDAALIRQAAARARGADVVIAVVGERASMSGEAKNRSRLDLPGRQQQLVDALVATGKPVVVVLLSGRALAVPELVERAGAAGALVLPRDRGRPRAGRGAVRRPQPGRQAAGHMAAQRRTAADPPLRSSERAAQHRRAQRLQGALARRGRHPAVSVRARTELHAFPARRARAAPARDRLGGGGCDPRAGDQHRRPRG